MIVITEADLAIGCENTKCTGQASYVIVLQLDSPMVKLYCAECTRRLTEGVAKVLTDNGNRAVHDLLDVAHLLTGEVITSGSMG